MAVDWNFRNSFRQEYESIKNQWNLKTKLVNGVNWHYADEGDESNTEKVVLFLHGFPECWYSWHHVLPLIKPNYRLIALDMKGYGESVPEINSSVADFEWHHVGDQIIALMDSLNIPQFYVVSHDWGSIIGSVMVSDHGLSYGQSNTAENHILGYFRLELDLLDIDVYDFGTYAKRLQILLFQSRVITNYLFSNAAKLIDIAYKSRMDTELSDIDRNFTVYTFASDVVKQNVPYYFSTANWDWNSAITKICKNNFTFPVIQLQVLCFVLIYMIVCVLIYIYMIVCVLIYINMIVQ